MILCGLREPKEMQLSEATLLGESTKERLLNVAIKFLESQPFDSITSEQIIIESGFSKGSLYHHYEDFSDLLEAAQVRRFANYVREALEDLIGYVENNSDPILVRRSFHELALAEQFTDSLSFRLKRFQIIYSAATNERMRQRIGPVQEELTQKWMRIYNICLARGWTKHKLDARAVSVLLQSTIVGRVVDDSATKHIDTADWIRTLIYLFDSVFFDNLDIATVHKQVSANTANDKVVVLLSSDLKCQELERDEYVLTSEVRRSRLDIPPVSDLNLFSESYLNAVRKMYLIEPIGPEFAKEILALTIANSDFPNYEENFETHLQSSEVVSGLWDSESKIFAAFALSEIVGFIQVTTTPTYSKFGMCIVNRKHRSQGLSTSLVSYAILSNLNKGIRSFRSTNDHLISDRQAVLKRLGFVEAPSTRTYTKS
jgi:AcrR family transcriptional regulator